MRRFVSKCHGSIVDWAVDMVNTYTVADGREMYCWVCRKCSKPCELKIVNNKKENNV